MSCNRKVLIEFTWLRKNQNIQSSEHWPVDWNKRPVLRFLNLPPYSILQILDKVSPKLFWWHYSPFCYVIPLHWLSLHLIGIALIDWWFISLPYPKIFFFWMFEMLQRTASLGKQGQSLSHCKYLQGVNYSRKLFFFMGIEYKNIL